MVYESPVSDVPLPTGVNYANYVLSAVDTHARAKPQAYALVDPVNSCQSVKFSELRAKVTQLAAALKSSLCLQDGQMVMLAMANSCEMVQLLLACALLNVTVTPINYTSNPREMSYQVRDSEAVHVLTDAATLPSIARALGMLDRCHVKSIIVSDAHARVSVPPATRVPVRMLSALLANSTTTVTLRPGTAHLAHLPYSSGTTGLPKGVMLSHDCITRHVAYVQHGFKHQLYTRVGGTPKCDVVFLPLYHMFGFVITMHHLLTGITTVLMHKFDSTSYFALIQKHRPTALIMVPPVALRLLKDPSVDSYDLSSVQLILSSAAPLAEHTVTELAAKHPRIKYIMQGYGMTEATAFASMGGVGKSGNCGQVAPNVKIKIVDPSTDQECAHGVDGEVRIHTPSAMAGYYKKPDATKNIFDSDGFICSGDIGHFDDQGFLYIVDRMKELIKVKGNQVAPAELESVLLTHPSVGDCAVIGVLGDDGDERPLAVVVQRQMVTEKELVQFVQDRVSRHKRLTGGVVFVQAIPKSPSGKILRRVVREKFGKPLKHKM